MKNTTTEDIISVDDHLRSFKEYIDSNERAILSARFGDGKSYFLNEFKEKHKADYEFITLYPVNYQVAENKDIFEYIKKDILVQLLSVIELDEGDYSNSMYLHFYIQNNSYDLISDLLGNVKVVGSLIKGLMKNLKKLDEFKKSIKDEKDFIEKFDSSFESETGGIYEFDYISDIIHKSIEKLKGEQEKETVLIIEDLDRIDPAHIFRILNIISAHIDRIYKVDEGAAVTANKFGFDKIVLICDYGNIKKIFHHFYGECTDFQGYIGKFSTIAPYEYSLKDHFKKYIIDNLDTEISQFENLSNTFAELVFARYMKDEDNSGNQERFKGIKEKLFIPSNFACDYPALTIPYTTPEVYFSPNLPDINREIPQNNRFAKFVYLLKRFKILKTFSEKYINEIPTDLRGTINHNVPEILTAREFFKLIGECWLLAPLHCEGTVHAQHGTGIYLELVRNDNYTPGKIHFEKIEVNIDNLFTRHAEDWIRPKMELVKAAKAMTKTIVPPNCY